MKRSVFSFVEIARIEGRKLDTIRRRKYKGRYSTAFKDAGRWLVSIVDADISPHVQAALLEQQEEDSAQQSARDDRRLARIVKALEANNLLLHRLLNRLGSTPE